MTLAKAFEAEPQLPEIYEADEEVRALIDMARKLEGVTRNAGKHAGGVVIAPTKITDFAPLPFRWTIKKASTCCSARKPRRSSSLNRAA